MKRLLAVLLAVAGALAVTTPASADAGPVLIAHRGGDRGTQNTLFAFMSSPAKTWEADIRWTASGWPVVLHDADLRVFGCPDVLIASVSILRARQCGPLLTLAQLVTAAGSRGASLWVELKTTPSPAQWAELDARLKPIRSRVVVQSFSAARLKAASSRGYVTAFLTYSATTDLPAGTDWYAPAWATLTPGQVQEMHKRGLKVAVWTPAPGDWPALPAGVSAIITDHPQRS